MLGTKTIQEGATTPTSLLPNALNAGVSFVVLLYICVPIISPNVGVSQAHRACRTVFSGNLSFGCVSIWLAWIGPIVNP